MENFNYQCGTKLIFGKGTESLVGEETKKYSTKILLHYGGNNIKKSGLYYIVIDSLKKSGIEFIELAGVIPNPRLELVYEGIKICKEKKIEFILAIGGGSVIDSAKAIAVGCYYDGDVWDFYTRKAEIKKALPLGVILTIPAAGSESSPNSVISYEGRKLAIGTDMIRPKFAIMNPELTFTLPTYQTASGIADMFAHIVERYFTNTKNVDLSDKMSEGVMKAIIKNARLIMKEPNNYDYRAEIMLCSTIAHNGVLGMGREEDWASHRIEHELSAKYDVTHGAGLAVIVPAWMKYVYKHDIKRFAQYGKNVWNLSGKEEEIALGAVDATKAFFKEIGLPTSLKEMKIDDKYLEEMAEKCTPVGSFVRLEKKDVFEIYKLALN